MELPEAVRFGRLRNTVSMRGLHWLAYAKVKARCGSHKPTSAHIASHIESPARDTCPIRPTGINIVAKCSARILAFRSHENARFKRSSTCLNQHGRFQRSRTLDRCRIISLEAFLRIPTTKTLPSSRQDLLTWAGFVMPKVKPMSGLGLVHPSSSTLLSQEIEEEAIWRVIFDEAAREMLSTALIEKD